MHDPTSRALGSPIGGERKTRRWVDIIAQVEGRLVPFEIKCRQQSTGWSELKGMLEFCKERIVQLGHLVTKDPKDFGRVERETEPGGHCS
jgi:hypothetical protein